MKEALVGYLEAVSAIGLIMGPLIGSILYAIGGYRFTFYAYGIGFIIISVFVKKMFHKRIDPN